MLSWRGAGNAMSPRRFRRRCGSRPAWALPPGWPSARNRPPACFRSGATSAPARWWRAARTGPPPADCRPVDRHRPINHVHLVTVKHTYLAGQEVYSASPQPRASDLLKWGGRPSRRPCQEGDPARTASEKKSSTFLRLAANTARRRLTARLMHIRSGQQTCCAITPNEKR